MLPSLRAIWKVLFYFRDYRPQPVTLSSLWKWLSQYPSSSRNYLLRLLDVVIYLSEKVTVQNLISLNQDILERLNSDGIGVRRIIYVAIDTAGSSSHVMLNLLRDAENLERKGANFADSRDARTLQDLTNKLEYGAIVYVDDFAGSGDQFYENRQWVAQFIVGTFSEFFLAPVVCEEAFRKIEDSGVVPITSLRHTIGQRPLHESSNIVSDECKKHVVELSKKINPNAGLGYKNLATMVVFYKNSPNTMPLIFRGSLGQVPYKGIFPRANDLPFEKKIGSQPRSNEKS